MRERNENRLICVLFLAFLAGVMVLTLLGGKESFSAREKRYLAEAPIISSETIMSGDFSRKAEQWAGDHLPAREMLVGAAAWADRFANLQVTKDIYVGRSGRLYERPAPYDEKTIERNIGAIAAFADQRTQKVDLMLIPTAGYMMQEDIRGLKDPYMDEEIIRSAYQEAAGHQIQCVDLLGLFKDLDREKLYYRTDHHWTSQGAWEASRLYLAGKGKELQEKTSYRITASDGFYGSCYARACFWQTLPETLELWDCGRQFTVSFSDKSETAEGLFFPEHLGEADQYPVFLDGNHPLVTIRNHDPAARGSLLVIRDSFSNCMGCFLAEAYERVTMADLRYYRKPLSELAETGEFDSILIVYSVGNFMTDSNILWLS